MNNELFETLLSHFNIVGALLALLGIVLVTKVGKFLLFKVPALRDAREYNRAEDKLKWRKEKYPPMCKSSQRVGLACNIVFFLVVLPFCITLGAQPWWQIPLHVFVILMFYDFFYYLSHRFWFHGNGAMRQVHAVHHQARAPTYLDSHYVHPLETLIGLSLYMGSIVLLALVLGKFHLVTVVMTYVIYVQVNQINHTHVDLPRFPFRALTWISQKHAVHHQNMHKGNYATITLFYDRVFGTLD